MVALVGLVGEFPLNDDWSYVRSAQSWFETGEIRFDGWGQATLIGQILWGLLFCIPFGFSFLALRISSATAGLLGIVGTYVLIKAVTQDRFAALAGAVALAINPIYFQLSLTFMTDVPALAVSVFSCLYFTRWLSRESRWDMLLGSLIACWAVMIRQGSAVVPLAASVAYLLKHGPRRPHVLWALVPSVLSTCIWILYNNTMAGRHFNYNPALPFLALQQTCLVSPKWWFDQIIPSFIYLLYLGAFLIPFLLAMMANQQTSMLHGLRRRLLLAITAGSVIITSLLVWQGYGMPSMGNILFATGLGPLTLLDAHIRPDMVWPDVPCETRLWIMVTWFSVIGSLLLCRAVFFNSRGILADLARGRQRRETSATTFLILVTALYLAACLLTGRRMDRDMVFPLPFIMTLLAMTRHKYDIHRTQVQSPNVTLTRADNVTKGARPGIFLWMIRTVSLWLLLCVGYFTVGATHDYLAWNRARWRAVNDLTNELGITPSEIDGGFEFNGWHLYNPRFQHRPGKSWWWVEEDAYAISFGIVEGYTEMRRYPFQRWVPPGRSDIKILQKVSLVIQPAVAADEQAPDE